MIRSRAGECVLCCGVNELCGSVIGKNGDKHWRHLDLKGLIEEEVCYVPGCPCKLSIAYATNTAWNTAYRDRFEDALFLYEVSDGLGNCRSDITGWRKYLEG